MWKYSLENKEDAWYDMINNDFDPYTVLMQNAGHIEQLAQAQNNHSKILQECVSQQRELMTALVKINTELQDALHRITKLERSQCD